MGKWLEHPKYVAARDRLVEYLRAPQYRFRRLKPVIFLCGGASSTNRDRLRDYSAKHLPFIDIFYAERVWEQIAGEDSRSALEMESDLAQLADVVVIIVESPGTFAELGAFSLAEPLRQKLLPIVDEQYRGKPSFLSNGPLRWIERESKFAPTIYVPFPKILEAAEQFEDRIRRIPKPHPVKLSDLASSPKHLVFFISDLVSVVYPATIDAISCYMLRIAPSIVEAKIDVPTLVGLAVGMGLVRAKKLVNGGSEQTFFCPGLPKAVARPFHHRRLLDLPSQRAEHVSVLLSIPEAKAALEGLNRIQ